MCQLATSAGLNVREREQTEMAALCPGVQYGLSSQENFGENKDLVFVKLTDSAYRAIEEYLRLQKQNKHLPRTPTIKFLGNEGQLSFPSSSANNNNNNSNGTSANNSPSMSSATSTTTFSFSLSPTADMEGPGGSFECVQQRQSLATPRSAGGTLAGLGPITHKMRVHATEDVYEETRKRMTFAEKVHKNKCTREIKPNQTDIGRKVKVKQLQHHHQVQLSSQSAARGGNSGGGSGSTSSGSNSNVNMRRSMAIEQYQTTGAPVDRTAASSTSTVSAAAAISSSTVNNSVANNSPLKHQSGTPYSPSLNNTNNHSNSLNSSATNLYNSGNNGLLDRIGGGGGMQQRFNGQSLRSNISKPIKQSMNSLLRRPLRERLIQLLALRPFKKIEILERFNKEGLRERNGISSVLKQVATSKDNCYHLNPVMWNDVQEEWPFYTEEEKQVLKRRKPQNLTPPGGSDGGSSTGSGNSPTSTHPGSPPSTSTTTMSTSGRHRVSHLSSNLQLQQQQPRDRDNSSALGGSGHQMHGAGGAGYRPSATPAAAVAVMMVGDNGRRQQSLPVDRRDASGMNPRSRQLGVGVGGYGLVGKRHLSDDEDVVDPPDDCGRDGSRKRQCDSSHILSFGVNRDPKTWKPDLTTNLPHQQTSSTYHHHQLQQQHPPNNNTFDSLRDNNAPPLINYHPSRTSSTPKQPTTPPKQTIVTDDHQQTNNSSVNWRNNNTNTSGDNAHAQQKQLLQRKEVAVRVSPDRIDRAQAERSAVVVMVTVVADEYDDYLREYTGIGDLEQRRRYKSDFNAVYDEYKELHGVVESVSRRFQILDERLKGEPTNKTPKYNEIKEQIMREYKQTKSNEQHQNAKRRFEYLHRKLSHIKDLVTQYDQQIQLHEDEQQQQQQQTTAATTTNSY